MEYNIKSDITLIRDFFNLSQEELANKVCVEQITICRTELGESNPREELINRIYNYCFINGLRLNMQKEMLYKDDIADGHILLVHASKIGLDGDISINKGRTNNDFGNGFYCGDSYEKSVSYICKFSHSSVYYLDFNPIGLKVRKFSVNTEWMLAIAYFRGLLEEYKENITIKQIIDSVNNADYIIAPIADNRMFEIIDTFINGEITDEQCQHCLAATNLGMQYVFKTNKSLKHIKILERCFVPSKEKEFYQKEQVNFLHIGIDKSKIARIQYKGKGKYIGEILL